MARPGDVLLAAMAARTRPPGVEPGVSGVEKRFQQNRQFGKGGAFPPYYGTPEPKKPYSPPHARGGRGNGVFYGYPGGRSTLT